MIPFEAYEFTVLISLVFLILGFIDRIFFLLGAFLSWILGVWFMADGTFDSLITSGVTFSVYPMIWILIFFAVMHPLILILRTSTLSRRT